MYKTLTGNKVYRKEGDQERLYSEIRCPKCGTLTYERRQSRIEAALQAYCRSCRGTGVIGGKRSLRSSQAAYKHDGRSKHPLYSTYHGMRNRCNNIAHKAFYAYGARGITVCQEWLDDFWQFVADVGDRPDGTTLDRIDGDKGYTPDNCRWSDWSTQMRNRRRFKRSAA